MLSIRLPLLVVFSFLSGCFYQPIEPADAEPFPEIDDALGLGEVSLLDDASKLSTTPGSYEWWNFFAAENGGYGDEAVSISTIFNPADLFNLEYRRAVYEWRKNPESMLAPDPRDYPLLQINVTQGDKKLFSTINVPSGTITEFPKDRAFGLVESGGLESSFTGYYDEQGVKTFEVKIDALDTFTKRRLQAEIICLGFYPWAISPGLLNI